MKFKLLLATICLMAGAVAVHAEEHAHWTYEGHGDAAHWGDLEEGYATCKLGKEQSPIDIRAAKKAKLDPIGFDYTAGAAEVLNNGHTVQVNLTSGGAIKLPSGDYKLVQFHFHTPSEEKIHGKNFPLVAHFVHKNAEGKLAVVAVLFKEGKENAALKSVFDNMPANAGETKALEGGINPLDILPAKRAYYAFMGSLTTPPCSEGVRWHVLKKRVELSSAQLAAFRKLYLMNARPVQPLNGREVQVSE